MLRIRNVVQALLPVCALLSLGQATAVVVTVAPVVVVVVVAAVANVVVAVIAGAVVVVVIAGVVTAHDCIYF